MAQTKEAFFARLDAIGAALVKTNLATNVYLNPGERVWVVEWLERSNEASQAEQASLARRAAAAAETANSKADIAIKIAAASMIITMIGILAGVIVPHYWH